MAKEIAISKRIKITEAQQYMLLSVLVASLFLGAAISLTIHFINQISFNANVIAEEEKSIVTYSQTIENIGICESPKGSVYSDEELAECDPDNIEISEIPDTLRSDILENLAANSALTSVPNTANSNCQNPQTGKNYTYKELSENLENTRGSDESNDAKQLFRSCSALRVIPDALPSTENQEALLASLDKVFKVSGWNPESLSPTDEIEESELAPGLNSISVSLSIEADSGTTKKVLDNIEKSIREFDIQTASFEWNSNSSLEFSAQALAYYVDSSSIIETTKTISPDGKNKTGSKK